MSIANDCLIRSIFLSAIHSELKKAFAQKLRDIGCGDVQLIDTAQEVFGSRRQAAMMMLGESRMLVGLGRK